MTAGEQVPTQTASQKQDETFILMPTNRDKKNAVIRETCCQK